VSGDLLHMDVSRYARFERLGTSHRRSLAKPHTDDQSSPRRLRLRARNRRRPLRLAYVELLADERGVTVTAFVERALDWFQAHGVQAKRVMTDNAFAYVNNRSLRELLAAARSNTYAPRPTAKTTQGRALPPNDGQRMGLRLSYRTSHHRTQALPHWLEHYNQRRPHSGSATGHPSAAFTTSVGRTTRRAAARRRRPRA